MSHAIIPLPEAGVSVRVATMDDLTFIDELQKKQRDALGFMFLTAIQQKIERGEILIASDGVERVGYCIGADRYFKHDDVGILYQMNVVAGRQRAFIGATLLKAMFDNAAYGCKLFCCWCAQDLQGANRFWEAMGFVPLAFRAGSEKKSRVHIFWQKRIRANDTTTPWWFPAKTDAGAIREDRLVLPIPPGLRWFDEMPILKQEHAEITEKRTRKNCSVSSVPSCSKSSAKLAQEPAKRVRAVAHFGGPPTGAVVEPVVPVVETKAEEAPKPAKPKREKRKADPKMIAAARELRDRWLEHVNSGQMLLEGAGKYDVARVLPAMPERPTLLLPAA